MTTADLARALAHPNIKNSFETQSVFYGHDPRPTDGAILVIRRTDGTSLGIGGPCIADDRLCQLALKPGMLELSAFRF